MERSFGLGTYHRDVGTLCHQLAIDQYGIHAILKVVENLLSFEIRHLGTDGGSIDLPGDESSLEIGDESEVTAENQSRFSLRRFLEIHVDYEIVKGRVLDHFEQ